MEQTTEQFQAKFATLTAERDNYRTLLIQAGRSIPGTFLSDEVSAEFLKHVPEEIRLFVERLDRQATHLDELQSDLSTKYAAETAARLELHAEVVRLREQNSHLEQVNNSALSGGLVGKLKSLFSAKPKADAQENGGEKIVYCTGCGSPDTAESRAWEDFCEACSSALGARLEACGSKLCIPRYFACFANGEDTVRLEMHICNTPGEAMAYAMRAAERNSWKLLQVNDQDTLEDIFRDPEYRVFVSEAIGKSEPVTYNAKTLGQIPKLHQAA